TQASARRRALGAAAVGLGSHPAGGLLAADQGRRAGGQVARRPGPAVAPLAGQWRGMDQRARFSRAEGKDFSRNLRGTKAPSLSDATVQPSSVRPERILFLVVRHTEKGSCLAPRARGVVSDA